MSDAAETPGRILVVEDTATQAELARLFLTGLGHDVRVAPTATDARDIARDWLPDGILLDLELPDYNGLELLRQLRADRLDAVVIVVTAHASMEVAKDAIRAGAEDFVVKPYNKDRLSVTLRNALAKRALERSRRVLESELTDARAQLSDVQQKLVRRSFAGFIGASPAMQAAYRTIESVGTSRASVFITGESGTGKELAAEAVHRSSPRAGRPFVALNCGAIPRDLLESEVFGHVKGAFTGATADRAGAAKLADGGTLFLDEIAEMPLDMQVKLLRFVQTGVFQPVGSSRTERVDVRFVCATNREPMQEVQAGRFREDLFYRLYVVPLDLPPLRARGDDVLLIARHFLATFSGEEKRRFRGFSPQAERILLGYAWPGNVRQLQNVIRNIVVLHDGVVVEPAMIPPAVRRSGVPANEAEAAAPAQPDPVPLAEPQQRPVPAFAPAFPAPPRPQEALHFSITRPPDSAPELEPEIMPLAEMERRLVLAALRRTNQDVPRAAALLEINPSTIYRKLSAWRAEGKAAPHA